MTIWTLFIFTSRPFCPLDHYDSLTFLHNEPSGARWRNNSLRVMDNIIKHITYHPNLKNAFPCLQCKIFLLFGILDFSGVHCGKAAGPWGPAPVPCRSWWGWPAGAPCSCWQGLVTSAPLLEPPLEGVQPYLQPSLPIQTSNIYKKHEVGNYS